MTTAQTFPSFDGEAISWTEVGTGRPVVLLHGLFSSAAMNWHKFGTAAAIAAKGFRVITPDFRAHGASAASRDPAAYPGDVLAMDIEALVAHLCLTDFDLGGYSLGARTAVRLLVRGMQPRRAVLGGMGLSGIIGGRDRADWFLHVIDNRDSFATGTPGYFAAAFMKQGGIDPDAARGVLRSQLVTPEAELRALTTPTLIVCGRDDHDNGSAAELAAALPDARLTEIPGNHMTAVTVPEFGAAIGDWLAG